jgi:hypothetical protein
MQAITTRYLPPTNFRGSRVKAQCEAGSLTISWSYDLDPDANHDAACAELVKRLGWSGPWLGGTLPQSNPAHRCYVCVPRSK